jgi:hypothetical protein
MVWCMMARGIQATSPSGFDLDSVNMFPHDIGLGQRNTGTRKRVGTSRI